MTEIAQWARGVRSWERADGDLQVGHGPNDGVVLARLSPAERRFLQAVGGRTGGAGEDPAAGPPDAGPARLDAALAQAVRSGADAARLREMLRILTDARLLEVRRASRDSTLARPRGRGDRPAQLALDEEAAARLHGPDGPGRIAARAGRRIIVDGDGPVPRRVGAVLREAGFGDVRQGAAAADDADLDLRGDPAARPPDLVVLTFAGVGSAARGVPWRRRGIPHLAVVADGHRISVGPLVLPGAPCLRCLDLHRTDRDPSWPLLLAQTGRDFEPRPVGCDSALTVIGAGLVSCLARPLLEDGLHLPGVSLEVTLPDPDVVRRQWPIHPLCGCGRHTHNGPGAHPHRTAVTIVT